MKLKFLLLFMFSAVGNSFAQGVWTGESATPFVYSLERTVANPGSGANALASGFSISKMGSAAGFLPFPSEGTSKVIIGTDGSASLTASDATSKLALTASSNTVPTKFSAYKIPSASAVSSIFLSFTMPATTAQGVVHFVFGNTASADADEANIFSDASAVSRYYDPANHTLFGAIRLDVYGGNYPSVSFRTARTGPDGVGVPPTFQDANTPSYFEKGSVQNIEFYCNNFTTNVTYLKGGVTYTVIPQTYQWWVNDARQKYVASGTDFFDFPSSKEIAPGLAVNSFGIVIGENTTAPALPLVATVGNFAVRNMPQSTLPVTISSFTGKNTGGGIQLNLTTASEHNNSHFDVLRSGDQNSFSKIGEIQGSGNSTFPKKYSFYDAQPLSGVNYYQLKQVDTDGQVNTTSSVIAVQAELDKSEFKIISLSEGKLSFTIDNKSQEQTNIKLVDLNGNLILSQTTLLSNGNNAINLKLPSMVTGIYVLVVSNGTGSKSLKFNKR